MKATVVNSCLVSAERGTNSGSSNLGFIAGQSFGAAVVGYPSGDHTLCSGVWESGNDILDKMSHFKEDSDIMKGWRGSQDLITSAGRRLKLLGSALKGSGKQNVDAAMCQRAQNWLFSEDLPLFQQKKPEVPPPSTNPFLEDETGAETDEIVMEKSDTDKVSL